MLEWLLRQRRRERVPPYPSLALLVGRNIRTRSASLDENANQQSCTVFLLLDSF